jgi:hypothetical protein
VPYHIYYAKIIWQFEGLSGSPYQVHAAGSGMAVCAMFVGFVAAAKRCWRLSRHSPASWKIRRQLGFTLDWHNVRLVKRRGIPQDRIRQKSN